MTVAVPLADPDVAVMVAVPSATAVTSPAAETVATDELDVTHVTVAPEMMFPPESLTVATRVAVSPADVKLRLVGARVTDWATWLTVTVAVALTDPDVAVMVAVPSMTAVTSPAAETVATDALDVAHVTVAPEMMFPAASLTVATRVAVSLADVKLTLVGESATEAAV